MIEKPKITIDYKKTYSWFKKNYMIFLILIPMILSICLRIQPAYLPITDEWAENTVNQNIMMSIDAQIENIYPQLPLDKKQELIDIELNKFYAENSAQIQQQTDYLSQEFKNRMQDEDGNTYLLAIDPYLWYGYSKNFIETGNFGTGYNEEGKSWNYLRNGRIGRQTGLPFNSLVTVIFYKIADIFGNFSVMQVAFFVPLIIMTLAVIPLFFIMRRFTGVFPAFFASCIFAVHPALMSRTVAGFSDTDCYTVFFPLMCIWFLFEAVYTKEHWKQLSLISLSGMFFVFFNIAWGSGFWYVFDLVIGVLVLYIIMSMIKERAIWNKVTSNKINMFVYFIVSFAFFRGLFALFYFKGENFFIGFRYIFDALFVQPFWLLGFKDVATSTIFPNVLTTVAELNTASIAVVISSVGSKSLFLLSIIGVFVAGFMILRALKEKDNDLKIVMCGIVLIGWYAITLYGATVSLRFSALFIPSFAIMLGVVVSILLKYVDKISEMLKINKIFISIVFIFGCLVLLLVPITQGYTMAKNEIPSYNDAWQESLDVIMESSETGMISSWWDFGHQFVAMGERHVTHDGGDQNAIYWIGKTLLTDDEDEAISILRTLNCGQQEGYKIIYDFLGDEYASIILFDGLILMNKEDAEKMLMNFVFSSGGELYGFSLDRTTKILSYTHCSDIIPHYVITSEDMVGKSGVYTHFGSWNFTRAEMYNKVKGADYDEGVAFIKNLIGADESQSRTLYNEIQSAKADQWITGWYNYVAGVSACEERNGTLFCANAVMVELDSYDTVIGIQEGVVNVASVVYIDDGVFVVKEFVTDFPYSVGIIKSGDTYYSIMMDNILAESMFTRLFFFDGVGLEYFEKISDTRTFMGQKIQVWGVDLE